MGEKSFLKGYCPKKNRYWGMTLEKFGGKWEIIDVIPLTPEQAKVTASLVEQPYFDVHKNLQACRYDQRAGRRIRTSDRVPCPKNDKVYSFHCVYCKNMELSYEADLEGSGLREGDTIKLSQGQEVKIAIGGRPLEEIELNVGWDPIRGDTDMDIDSSVILFNSQSRSSEVVYFGELEDRAKSVKHHGDNLTGEPVNGQSDVDESIDIFLKRVPMSYDKIAIVINIYRCDERRQNFGMVRNLFIRLYDKKSHKKLCDYQVSHNISSATALIIGLVQRKGDGWTFKATGDASCASSVRGLESEVILKYK